MSKYILFLVVALSLYTFACNDRAHISNTKSQRTVSQIKTINLGKQSTMMWEWEEWSLENPTYSGNPFDLVATVTFEHQDSNQQHTTEMFYAGDQTWNFRFTGTALGEWTFETASSDSDLDGLKGTVIVEPNPDPDTYGFVTNIGNQWARFQGNEGQIEPLIPQFAMPFDEPSQTWTDQEINQKLNTFLDQHGFNGVFLFGSANWVDHNLEQVRFDQTSNRNPDPIAFENFERVINEVHDRGGLVHIWYAGDTARAQSPESAFGDAGAKTIEEQRLLRYIAARLGPLPGWIMGYGYDNPEHVTTSELQQWGAYLRDHLGWKHYLGARDQGENIVYQFWPEADFYSRGDWFNGVSYEDIVAVLNSNPNVPHSFDERWWPSRLNEEGQRQLMWKLAIAGGASGIWAADGNGDPYTYPYWFQTWNLFWQEHFLANLKPVEGLSSGFGLKTPDNEKYVFYQENTDSISLDLSGMSGEPTAIAVNTKQEYEEINLGTLSSKQQTLELPEVSDWAIAVGNW
jgi:hypothetical protein